jgi:Ca2+-binding EF-hand superfamily protein
MRTTRILFGILRETFQRGSALQATSLPQKRQRLIKTVLLGGTLSTTCFYLGKHYKANCKSQEEGENNNDVSIIYKASKLRDDFSAKASLEYNGEYFMTGRDFLEAWITDEYYEKEKIELYDSEYDVLINSVKVAEEPSFNMLFAATALISYPDYIFLRSILKRPDDLSLMSFKMLDLDLNGYISIDEYYSLCKMFTKNDEGDPKKHLKTTLRVLLFNHTDDEKITLHKFEQLLKDVQANCLKAEFNRYRQKENKPNMISVQGFMRAVLRRTKVTPIQRARFIDKSEVYSEVDAITLDQFKSTITLLNNFSDFEVAVRMYQIAKKPLAREVFKRAVFICSGEKIDDEIVDILFYVFDEAGDGHLSHSEFVNIMKEMDTSVASQKGGNHTIGQYFRKCIRNEMIRSYA